MHSETTGHYLANAVCTGETWDHKLRIMVANDGKVTCKAVSNLVSRPSCNGPGSWPAAMAQHQAKNATFSISGSLRHGGNGHPDQFELKFTETQIDGGTPGLLNYSLATGFRGNPDPTIVVPLQTDEITAQGITDTNASAPGVVAAIGHHKVNLSLITAPRADQPGASDALLKQCEICHTLNAGGINKVGPNLHGLFGRKAGSAPGFAYSAAMKNSAIVWDDATLKEFLRDPRDSLPGNRMSFPGIKDDAALADLLARLKQATQ